jgi:hypothetical protein
MSKYYLFLDDVRQPRNVTWIDMPNHDWTIVRSYKEFRDAIWNRGIPEFVAYDHDLADVHYNSMNHGDAIDYNNLTEKTGYDCAKFLCNECNKLNVVHPTFIVHSMNIVGGENIRKYIAAYNKTVK